MKAISLLLILLGCASHQEKNKPFDSVMSPVEAKARHYRQCYEESDSLSQKKEGKIKINFLISALGKVENVTFLESDFKDANFHACLQDIIKSLKYLPFEDGKSVNVVFPFNFTIRL
jgi:TonB family protein